MILSKGNTIQQQQSRKIKSNPTNPLYLKYILLNFDFKRSWNHQQNTAYLWILMDYMTNWSIQIAMLSKLFRFCYKEHKTQWKLQNLIVFSLFICIHVHVFCYRCHRHTIRNKQTKSNKATTKIRKYMEWNNTSLSEVLFSSLGEKYCFFFVI